MPNVTDHHWAISQHGSTIRVSKEDGDRMVKQLMQSTPQWIRVHDIFGAETLVNTANIENMTYETPEVTREAIRWLQRRDKFAEDCKLPEWEV